MLTTSENGIELAFNILSLANPGLNFDEISRLAAVSQLLESADLRVIELDVLMEILSLSNRDVDLYYVSKVVSLIKHYKEATSEARSPDTFVDVLGLVKKELDLDYFKRINDLTDSPDEWLLLEDSLSLNQFKSKKPLLDAVESLGILNQDTQVVIWGCWYGSILIPFLQSKVAKIVGIDLDDDVVAFAKNKLFEGLENIDLITDDIFATYRNFYIDMDLLINTSCEHMAPMKEWHWFKHGAMSTDAGAPVGEAAVQSGGMKVFASPKLKKGCHFAFQSNDMFDIEGHTNCVKTLQEFKAQLPARAEVLFEDEIGDDRGTRFMLVGRLN